MFETEAPLAELSREFLPETQAPAGHVSPEAVAPLQRMLSHPLSSTADHVRRRGGPLPPRAQRVQRVLERRQRHAPRRALDPRGALRLRDRGRRRRALPAHVHRLRRARGALARALPPLRSAPERASTWARARPSWCSSPRTSARARGAAPSPSCAAGPWAPRRTTSPTPRPAGVTAARVMRAGAGARGARRRPTLDYVNAHGTATPLNDAMETAALRALPRRRGRPRPGLDSSKGQIGHTLAAAGALEAAITAMAIAARRAPAHHRPRGGRPAPASSST